MTVMTRASQNPEWAINKAQQSHAQSGGTTTNDANNNGGSANSTNGNNATLQSQNSTSTTGWASAHIQFYQAELMQMWILLDNQSSTTIFCNPDMVSNIRRVDETLHLTTNAGVLTTNIMKADLPGWGEVWFDPTAVTNIFSYTEMADRYPVKYDNTVEDVFIVQLPHKDVRFGHLTNQLYVFKPPNAAKPHVEEDVQFINTVKRTRCFTPSVNSSGPR